MTNREALGAMLAAGCILICFAAGYEAGYGEGKDRALRDTVAADTTPRYAL